MRTTYKTLVPMLTILLICQNSIASNQPKQSNKSQIIEKEWGKLKPDSAGKTVLSPTKIKTAEIGQDDQGFVYIDPSTNTGKVALEKIKPNIPKEFDSKITIRAKNTPLNIVLKTIAKSTGYNIVFGPGTNSSSLINLDIDNIEIWRALNTMLFPISYGFRVENNDLVILSEETRVYRISLPPINSNINDLTSNESFVTSNNNEANSSTQQQNTAMNIRVGTKVVVENKLTELSLWNDISNNLRMMLTSTGKLSINKQAGVIIVSDLPNNLNKIDTYFNEVNKKISQQIQVDVKVVEVRLTDQRTTGVDWGLLTQRLGEVNKLAFSTNFATNAITSGNVSAFTLKGSHPDSGDTENGVSLVIKALEEYGNVEVVSQPKVALLNNTAAVIQVGTTQAFVDNSTVQTTQTGTITSLTTSQVQEGVTMRIMANIVNDDIYLNVVPVVTTIDSIRSVTSGNTTLEAPTTTTKSVNTMVKIKEGETVAIGGLITADNQDSRKGVPILSKMPIIGKLFSVNTKKHNKTELIIFITPKKVG